MGEEVLKTEADGARKFDGVSGRVEGGGEGGGKVDSGGKGGNTSCVCAPRVPPAFPPETSTILEDRPTSARSGKGDGGWNRLSKSLCSAWSGTRASARKCDASGRTVNESVRLRWA